MLAPAAFLAAATLAVLLVRAGLDAESEPAATVPTVTVERPTRTETQPTTTRSRQPQRRTYTIEEGDTLDQVALDHDTTVERLRELNPQVDANSLQVGQKIVVPSE